MIRSMLEGVTMIAWLVVLAVFVLCGCERHQHWHAAGPSAGEGGAGGSGGAGGEPDAVATPLAPGAVVPRYGDGAALPGEQVTAAAWCEPGERFAGGGCTFGKEPGSVLPITWGPMLEAGELRGYACTGLVRPDHDNHGTAYALALCEVL